MLSWNQHYARPSRCWPGVPDYFPRPEALGSRAAARGADGVGLAELPSSPFALDAAPGLGCPALRYCSRIFAAAGESAGFFLLAAIVFPPRIS